jgi:hypothetical protein
VVCVLEAVLAVSGGDDTARIVLPGAVLLAALAVSTVVRAGSPRRDAVLVALLAGSVALWRPWVIAPVPGDAWLNWFTPYYDAQYGHPAWFSQRLVLDSSLALGGLALAALPLLLRRWQPAATPVQPEQRVPRERRAPSELRRVPALSPGDAWLLGTGSAVELAASLKRRRRPAPRATPPSRAGTAPQR